LRLGAAAHGSMSIGASFGQRRQRRRQQRQQQQRSGGGGRGCAGCAGTALAHCVCRGYVALLAASGCGGARRGSRVVSDTTGGNASVLHARTSPNTFSGYTLLPGGAGERGGDRARAQPICLSACAEMSIHSLSKSKTLSRHVPVRLIRRTSNRRRTCDESRTRATGRHYIHGLIKLYYNYSFIRVFFEITL
jgi:hypothetical protein